MSNQYKKLSFQAPRSYQELTRNRPTKKRNFNYTSHHQDNELQNISMPISNHKGAEKDFSFENTQRYLEKQPPVLKTQYYDQKQQYSPIYHKNNVQAEVDSPTNEKQIDERLLNINSISSKINSVLNTQKKTVYKTPLVEKETNIEKAGFKQFSLKERNQASSIQTHKQRPSKSKYSYISNQDPIISKVSFGQSFGQNRYQSQNVGIQDFRKIHEIKKETQPQEPNQTIQSNFRSQAPPRANRKVSYLYEQQPSKDKIKQQIQLRIDTTLKKQKFLDRNTELDLKIDEIKHKILDDSPFAPSLRTKQPQNYDKAEQIEKFSQNGEISKMANQLSKLIQIDIILLKIRQAFQSSRQPNKWQQLKTQLQSRNIYLGQSELKQAINISIHEKNPFSTKKVEYPLNGVKDLAKLYAQSCRIWFQQLQKCVSMDTLAQQDFSMSLIDLNHKGIIGLEDLVCFVNVNSQKFYRNRDLAPLFKRFLKLQGKSMEKGSGQGISYGTFMDKLSR